MSAPAAELLPAAAPIPDRLARPTADPAPLSVRRLNLMRIGYLFMAVGLVLVKWPLIVNGTVATLPVYEGVVAVLLTAMSLLAFLGLRYPVAMLPVLMFEVGWKVIWMAVVGIPNLTAGDTNPQFTSVFFNVCFGVVVLAVTPWDYVWKRFVRAPGDPWR
jgi:hypothetical protein